MVGLPAQLKNVALFILLELKPYLFDSSRRRRLSSKKGSLKASESRGLSDDTAVNMIPTNMKKPPNIHIPQPAHDKMAAIPLAGVLRAGPSRIITFSGSAKVM